MPYLSILCRVIPRNSRKRGQRTTGLRVEDTGGPGGRHRRRDRKEARNSVHWKLDLVGIPASDVDRAKSFYVDKVGFNPTTITR